MKKIFIFCEGETEYNYIESLNRFLTNQNCYDVVLIPKIIKVSSPIHFLSVAREEIKKLTGIFNHLYFWIDYDIFKRENRKLLEIQTCLSKIKIPRKLKLENGAPVALFNIMNGEDFLILHYEDNILRQWEKTCIKRDHFNNPMVNDIYLPLFKKLILGYEKGIIPDNFITLDVIEKAISNSSDSSIKFESGVIELLQIILDQFL
jgi:hypothetical protein